MQNCIACPNPLKEISEIEAWDGSNAVEVDKILLSKLESREIVFTHGEHM